MGSKPSKPMPLAVAGTLNTARIDTGKKMLSMVWRRTAERVVEEAVRVYHLSPEQAAALRSAFGSRIQFSVEAV
jgi:hypothetical protein